MNFIAKVSEKETMEDIRISTHSLLILIKSGALFMPMQCTSIYSIHLCITTITSSPTIREICNFF